MLVKGCLKSKVTSTPPFILPLCTTREECGSRFIPIAIFRHDVDAGGVNFGEDAVPVLVEATTIEERQTVASWVQGIIKRLQIEQGSQYELQEYQKCLSTLESGRIEDH